MTLTSKLTTTTLLSAVLIGCGDNAPPPTPPKIDLGSSTETTSAVNVEPEATKVDEAKPADAASVKVLSQAEQRITATLDLQTEISFFDTPLTDVITFLGDFHNIPIIIDNEDLTNAAIPADSPVTRTLTGVKLSSALKIILDPLKLSYVIEDDVLKVITAAKVAKRSRAE